MTSFVGQPGWISGRRAPAVPLVCCLFSNRVTSPLTVVVSGANGPEPWLWVCGLRISSEVVAFLL